MEGRNVLGVPETNPPDQKFKNLEQKTPLNFPVLGSVAGRSEVGLRASLTALDIANESHRSELAINACGSIGCTIFIGYCQGSDRIGL